MLIGKNLNYAMDLLEQGLQSTTLINLKRIRVSSKFRSVAVVFLLFT